MAGVYRVSCPCCSYVAVVPVGRGALPVVHTPAVCGRCADFVDVLRPDGFELLGDDYERVSAMVGRKGVCPGCAAPVREISMREVFLGEIGCPSCGAALMCVGGTQHATV